MERVFTAVILLLIISTMPIYGQEGDLPQVESEIEVKLLYKKEFGELMVGPEGFPPPEIKEILLDEDIPQEDKDWLLNSLRIEIARREKALYTDDGKMIQLPDDLQSIWTSKNMKYMVVYAAHYDFMGMSQAEANAIMRSAHEASSKSIQWGRKWEEAGRSQDYVFIDSLRYWCHIRDSLAMIDIAIQRSTKHIKKVLCLETETGRVLWQKEGWVNVFDGTGDDVMPPSFVSDDGKTSVAVTFPHFINSAVFYNKTGDISGQIKDMKSVSGYAALSADGVLFYAVTNIRLDKPEVACFDQNGNVLWKQYVLGDRGRGNHSFAVADNHEYAIVSLDIIYGGAATTLIDKNARIVAVYDFGVERSITFSADGHVLAIPSDGGTLYFIESSTGKILWQKSLLSKHAVCDMRHDAKYIIETDAEFVRMYNSNGQVVLTDRLSDPLKSSSSSTIVTEFALSSRGNFFLLRDDKSFALYRVEVLDEGK
jgi:outer membrane protein assembly factor BamB